MLNEVKHLGSSPTLSGEHEILRLRHDTFEGHRAPFMLTTHRAPLANRGHYPFSAPAMMPSMKRRWKMRKMITIGNVPRNEPAITAPYSWS